MRSRFIPSDNHYQQFEDLITVQQAAEEFSYSPRTIVGYCAEGRIAAKQYGRQWIISRKSLKSFLQWRENRQTIH